MRNHHHPIRLPTLATDTAPPAVRRAARVATLVLAAATANAVAGHHCSPPGASSLFATMPITSPSFPPTGPTYPEGVAIVGDRVITTGPANFGTAGNGSPSQLTVFDRDTGALRAEVPLVGEDLSQEHALSEAAVAKDYVYAPSTQLGVLRWRFNGNHDLTWQESYSTPFCSVTIPAPCLQPTDKCPVDIRPNLPPLPNGIEVDAHGDVYVADSLQGIIWHMPKASQPHLPVTPEVLFCSAALQGSGTEGLSLFGANGLTSVGGDLYLSVTFGPLSETGPTSVIYRLPKDRPTAAELQVVYTYTPVEVSPGVFVPPIADGITYDKKSGHLFVVLGGQNQVSELDLAANPVEEVARYSRTDADHPFLNPSTIALDKGGVAFVTNHAITCCLPGDPSPSCSACTNAQDFFGVIELCTD